MLSKGCPQGSEFGPTLWRIAINEVLASPIEEHCHRVVYADDIVALVAANTRRDLVARTENHLLSILRWAERYELRFSAQKSAGLILRGRLEHGFTFQFGDERIRTVKEVKYLGIKVGPVFSFENHLKEICESSADMFSRLRATKGIDWGTNLAAALRLYRTVYLPRVSYAAEIWIDVVRNRQAVKKLGSAQRRALLAITGAYRTCSTDALQVLAGAMPLDLEIRLIAAKRTAKKEAWEDNRMRTAMEELLTEWQERWTASPKGRWTYRWFPEVRFRRSIPLQLDHFVAQLVTGHGDFGANLNRLGLRESPSCGCGAASETVEHFLYACIIHEEQRFKLEQAVLRSGAQWPCDMSHLVSSRMLFAATAAFAKAALTRKKEEGLY